MTITRILGPTRSFVAKVMPWVIFVCLAMAMLFSIVFRSTATSALA